MAENKKIRFYLDYKISPQLSKLLQMQPYSDSFAFKWKRIKDLQSSKFLTDIKGKKIFITTNIDYLDEDKYPLGILKDTIIVVITIPESSYAFGSVGYVLFNFLEFSMPSLTYQSKIFIDKDIKIYKYSSGSINLTSYDLIQFAKKEYVFKAKSSDINLYRIQNKLIKKGQSRKLLTYDDIYNEFPADIVTADIIDETVEYLKTQNIKVVDNYSEDNKPKSKGSQTDELKKYENEVESTLNDFFKNYAEEITEDANKKEAVKLSNDDLTPEINNHIEISTIKLPQLKEVVPILISDSTLALKKSNLPSNTEIKELKLKQRTDSLISSFEETDTAVNFLFDDNIPKIVGESELLNGRRISRNAKLVGDRGEEIVLKHLTQTLSSKEKETITWRSHEGETPGWDIDYANLNNILLAIEVKATTENYFSSIEISDNEWSAAMRLADHYYIYLVTKCASRNPQIQILQNPYKLRESGKLLVTPLIWKIELIS